MPIRADPLPEVDVISITITERPRVRGGQHGGRLAARTVIAMALISASLVAVIAAAVQTTGTSRSAEASHSQVSSSERKAIAAALGYPYPLRCLTITISAASADYALANVNRTSRCARYRGYLNASLHRVDGAWRLVLDEGQLFVPNSLLAPDRSRVHKH